MGGSLAALPDPSPPRPTPCGRPLSLSSGCDQGSDPSSAPTALALAYALAFTAAAPCPSPASAPKPSPDPAPAAPACSSRSCSSLAREATCQDHTIAILTRARQSLFIAFRVFGVPLTFTTILALRKRTRTSKSSIWLIWQPCWPTCSRVGHHGQEHMQAPMS